MLRGVPATAGRIFFPSPYGRGEARAFRAPSFRIKFSNSQAPAPVFFTGAGYAVFPPRCAGPFLVPPKNRGGGAPLGAAGILRAAPSFRKVRAPLRAPPGQACAVRAYLPAISVPGAALPRAEGPVFPGPYPGSFRRPSSASRPAIKGSPSWWGRTATRGLPGAGLRAPPAGAASHPASMTSHEDALEWMGCDRYIVI